jgi:DNA-binding transcriptional MerR regulator
MPNSPSPSGGKLVPIRTVCAMYNLNPNTLRTWERRYSIVKPLRSEGGHRVYGEQDLQNIEMMVSLLNQGVSPVEAARQTRKPTVQTTEKVPSRVNALRHKFRDAVTKLDTIAAHSCCNEAVVELGYVSAVEQLMFPELAYWGHRWEVTSGGIATEHLASLAVRASILDQQRKVMHLASGPRVVLAMAPLEQHELPMLHAANLLFEAGFCTPSIFVSGMPMADILESAQTLDASVILLSATITPRSSTVREWVDLIIKSGWEEKTILVGTGFHHSRVFSESKIRAASGNFQQVVALVKRILQNG